MLGHGIQNYSCSANTTEAPEAKGALAVLYDITALYPGTPRSGLPSIQAFNALTTRVLWTSNLPLNFLNVSAAASGIILPSKDYAATATPFQLPKDLTLDNLAPIKYAGHHYFDSTTTANFDLISPGNLKAHVVKKASVAVPASADKGLLKTGAVQWLQLGDSGLGISHGLNQVYRVVTAGGIGESCAVAGKSFGSVPYTAQYWFYS